MTLPVACALRCICPHPIDAFAFALLSLAGHWSRTSARETGQKGRPSLLPYRYSLSLLLLTGQRAPASPSRCSDALRAKLAEAGADRVGRGVPLCGCNGRGYAEYPRECRCDCSCECCGHQAEPSVAVSSPSRPAFRSPAPSQSRRDEVTGGERYGTPVPRR